LYKLCSDPRLALLPGLALLLLLVVLVACDKGAHLLPPSHAGSGSAIATTTPADSATPTSPLGPKMGQPCGEHDLCGTGLTCMSYYGVGGNRLKSCEVPCDPKAPKNSCPEPTHCTYVGDGPSPVCR
jgi:hypothetical protein